jgi:8-oxo-dGTP diphosphatase
MISSISIVIPFTFQEHTFTTWMQLRTSDPFKGLWEFPGGKVEPEESPLQAAIREVREEVGVDLASEDLTLFTIKHTHPKINKIVVLNVFVTEKLKLFPKQGTFTFQRKRDFSEVYQEIPAPNIEIFKMLESYYFDWA